MSFENTSPSSFTYNASALALGGLLRGADGRTKCIPSQASVALSPSGGCGSATAIQYSHESGISFAYAESSVSSDETASDYLTTSTVAITGLNVLGRLRVAFMKAEVVSRHPKGQSDATFTLKASYNGIEIDGVEIVPVFDFTLIDDCPTDALLDSELRNNGAKYLQRFGLPDEKALKTMLDHPVQPVRGTLISDIHYVERPGYVRSAEPKAYGLDIPKLGKAHFAEYLVKPGRRRITLLRLDLDTMNTLASRAFARSAEKLAATEMDAAAGGETLKGEYALASVDGNGSPPWKP